MADQSILILHSRWMPYNDAIASELSRESVLHVVAWADGGPGRRDWLRNGGAAMSLRQETSDPELIDLVNSRSWAALVVSGRMDSGYLSAARAARKRGIPVVGGSDEFFVGTRKQRVKRVLSPFIYGRYFDFLWVPGPRHAEWARSLGYDGRTIPNLLAGDTNLFSRAAVDSNVDRTSLLYMGRPAPAKGVDVLIEAFRSSQLFDSLGTELRLVGGTAEQFNATGIAGVTCVPFAAQENLVAEAAGAAAFVLPSRREPWGVVVHEAASAGLPLILSDRVGAADQFLVDGRNGWKFRSESVPELSRAMQEAATLDDRKRARFGELSHSLSMSCSPTASASALLHALGRSSPSTDSRQ